MEMMVIWTVWTAPNCPDQPSGGAAAAVQLHAAQKNERFDRSLDSIDKVWTRDSD